MATRTSVENYSFDRKHMVGSTYALNTTVERSYNSSRTGVSLSNWRELVKAGSNATTPYSADITSVVSREYGSGKLSGQGVRDASGKIATYSQSLAGYFINPPTLIAHLTTQNAVAEAAALTQIYKKIASEQQRMNSPAVLAEFGDVMRQFGKPCDALIDLTNRRLNRLELESRGLKGTVAFKRIKWAQVVASTWLEYSFGLAPLISDTKAAAEALARWQYEITGEQHFRTKVVGRGTSEAKTHTASTNIDIGGTGSWFRGKRADTTQTMYKVQYVAGLNLSPIAAFGSNDRLQQLLGFNHANWIPAIWEVVPWSWLIDYFSNVGDILNAGVTSTSSVSWLCKTVTQDTLVTSQMDVDGPSTAARISAFNVKGGGSGTAGKVVIRRVTMTRSIPLSLGVPPLTLSLPGKPKQIANMVAVLLARRPTSSALWLT